MAALSTAIKLGSKFGVALVASGMSFSIAVTLLITTTALPLTSGSLHCEIIDGIVTPSTCWTQVFRIWSIETVTGMLVGGSALFLTLCKPRDYKQIIGTDLQIHTDEAVYIILYLLTFSLFNIGQSERRY